MVKKYVHECFPKPERMFSNVITERISVYHHIGVVFQKLESENVELIKTKSSF